MKDSTTYRFPRTMQQAFGPYTDNNLEPMEPEVTNLLPWLVWFVLTVVVILNIVFWV